jgi:mRNA-degrading endonuclease YafQ of YafQ-DinJ toxin-antitoxin module
VSWAGDYDSEVKAQIVEALKAGDLTQSDLRVIKKWVDEVETKGLEFAQANPTWRDHELTRGKWIGHRAISFSYEGRVIYRVVNGKLIIKVVRVTPDHDYA